MDLSSLRILGSQTLTVFTEVHMIFKQPHPFHRTCTGKKATPNRACVPPGAESRQMCTTSNFRHAVDTSHTLTWVILLAALLFSKDGLREGLIRICKLLSCQNQTTIPLCLGLQEEHKSSNDESNISF